MPESSGTASASSFMIIIILSLLHCRLETSFGSEWFEVRLGRFRLGLGLG